jgi:hypothetical protein
MRRGVVYACSHRDWIAETIRSALSFARHMPDLDRHLFIPSVLLKECRNELSRNDPVAPFTRIVALKQIAYPHRPRFESMLRFDLDRVIFIDGDTLLLAPAHELFEVLDHFDVALTIAPHLFHPRAEAAGIYDVLPKVSMAVPEWNGGLMVARKSPRFHKFVIAWDALFLVSIKAGYLLDQASLRSALATSDLRVATLASNYNFRANVEQMARGKVKILHAHGDLPAIARTINATARNRHYQPDKTLIHGFKPQAAAKP